VVLEAAERHVEAPQVAMAVKARPAGSLAALLRGPGDGRPRGAQGSWLPLLPTVPYRVSRGKAPVSLVNTLG